MDPPFGRGVKRHMTHFFYVFFVVVNLAQGQMEHIYSHVFLLQDVVIFVFFVGI